MFESRCAHLLHWPNVSHRVSHSLRRTLTRATTRAVLVWSFPAALMCSVELGHALKAWTG